MKKYLFIIIPLLAVALCSFLLLTSLDNKIFDLFLRALPSLEQDSKVLIIKIDDPSIEMVGTFPWTRDIMADAIVFLREMGAETVTFDLSYLDKSPEEIDRDYLFHQYPKIQQEEISTLEDFSDQLIDGIKEGFIPNEDLPAYQDYSRDLHLNSIEILNRKLMESSVNIDHYFADRLQFFGQSYLTLTMISEKDIIGKDKTFNIAQEEKDWLEEYISIKTDYDSNSIPDKIGVYPAIPVLLQKAGGAGFVNADPDQDGFRRRINLYLEFQDHLYGHLIIPPLMAYLNNPELEISNTAFFLRNATVHGELKDIRIPRASDGSVLIKWPKVQFDQYNQISAWNLIRNNELEKILIEHIYVMKDAGMLAIWDSQLEPLMTNYENAEYIKQSIFDEGEDPDFGISVDEYIRYRSEFFQNLGNYLNGDYESQLINSIGDDQPELKDYIMDAFSKTRKQYSELMEIRDKARKDTEGSFSIIGMDATSMTDSGQTTFQERFPNVGIYSALANMILSEDFIDDTHPSVSIIFALILSIGLGFIIHRFTTGKAMITGLATIFSVVILQILFFIITKKYIGVIVPLLSVAVTFISLSAISFLDTIKEKSFLRNAFSRYLSPDVIEEIITDPSKLNLGGEKRELSAIFTDIKGFSTISEKMDPVDLVKLLNIYLTRMSNTVLQNRGTIDKYEGDAIICFFGAPIKVENHAHLACRTAIEMKKAELEINNTISEEGLYSQPIFTRIGINTGDMIVGNMGTADKMDYTIIGNAVNLAARLEGVNKQYNTRGILISEKTKEEAGENFITRRLDRVRVVGINTPIRLYELLEEKNNATEELLKNVKDWENAMDLFENGNFKEALEKYKGFKEDYNEDIANIYIERCQEFIKTPSDKKWDGVFNLTQK